MSWHDVRNVHCLGRASRDHQGQVVGNDISRAGHGFVGGLGDIHVRSGGGGGGKRIGWGKAVGESRGICVGKAVGGSKGVGKGMGVRWSVGAGESKGAGGGVGEGSGIG